MSFLKNRYVKWTLISLGLIMGVFVLWMQLHKEFDKDKPRITRRYEGTLDACYELSFDNINYCFPQNRFKDIKLSNYPDRLVGLYVTMKSHVADPQGYANGNIRISKEVDHLRHRNVTYPESVLISRFNGAMGSEDWGNPDLIRSLTHDPARQNKWTQVGPDFCRSWSDDRCFILVKSKRINAAITIDFPPNPPPDYTVYRSAKLLYQEPNNNASYSLSYGSNTGTDEDLIAATMALLEEFREIERAAIVQ